MAKRVESQHKARDEAKTDKIPLQLKSQGITFIDYEDQLYLLTSSSLGVDNPSALIVEKLMKQLMKKERSF